MSEREPITWGLIAVADAGTTGVLDEEREKHRKRLETFGSLPSALPVIHANHSSPILWPGLRDSAPIS